MIEERIKSYDLLEEERSALSEVLHRIEDRARDRRKPVVDVEQTIKKALVNIAICRGTGIDNLDQMYANVIQALTAYRKEYRC